MKTQLRLVHVFPEKNCAFALYKKKSEDLFKLGKPLLYGELKKKRQLDQPGGLYDETTNGIFSRRYPIVLYTLSTWTVLYCMNSHHIKFITVPVISRYEIRKNTGFNQGKKSTIIPVFKKSVEGMNFFTPQHTFASARLEKKLIAKSINF